MPPCDKAPSLPVESAVRPEPGFRSRAILRRLRFHRSRWQALLVGLVLLALAWPVARYKHDRTRAIEFTGHADASGYVHMARSLAKGRGLTVDYVSWHFIPYDRSISRREDHWPPFLSLCMAPWVRLLGDEPWVYRLAPIAIGSFGLPLAAAALAGALSRRGYVALWAGVLAMAHPMVFNLSTEVLSDVPTAMLTGAYLAAVLGGARRDDRFALAGLMAGLAFLSKGSQLLLLPLLPLLAVVVAGWRALRRRGVWLGVLVGGLLVGWYLAGVWRAYGDPLHNTQRFAAGYVGLLDWEQGTYSPYWGRNLPRLSDRWTVHADRYDRAVKRYREEVTRWAVFGPRAAADDWRLWGVAGDSLRRRLSGRSPEAPARRGTVPGWRHLRDCRDPALALVGSCGVALGLAVLVGGILAGPWRWWNRHKRVSRRTDPVAWPPLFRPIMAMVLFSLFQWIVLVYLWQAMPRLALVFLPVTLALGCTAISRLVEGPWRWLAPRWLARHHGWATLGLAGLLLTGGFRYRDHLETWHTSVTDMDDWLQTGQDRHVIIGKWFAARAPTAVVMTRYPWQMLYHAAPGNKAVTVPLASAETLFAIARYYRVTHLVHDANRPALAPFISGERPGLRRVPDAPDSIYELDYDQLPGGVASRDVLP